MIDRFQQSVGVESAPLRDEVILFTVEQEILRPEPHVVLHLVGAQTAPGGAEIAERLGVGFEGVALDQAQSDVDSTLNEMLALGLVVRVEASSSANRHVEV